MNGQKLRDRLYRGLGITARHIGHSVDAYRPSGPFGPLDTPNRFLRLPATFTPASGGAGHTNVYGDPLWHGVFDASYTRPGDYLVMDDATFFVASQAPLLPILCVKANRTISIVRPSMQTGAAANTYGGYTSSSSMSLIERWPASVLGENRSSASLASLPTDQAVPYWNVLLPIIVNVVPSPGDLIADDLNRTAVIAGTELTDLGWRISAKLVTT